MTDIFDVVSDPTRREILGILLSTSMSGSPELSVSDLVGQTGQTQPTVSKQLRVLRDAGLVVVREEGQHRFYRLDPAPLRALADWVGAFEPQSAARDRRSSTSPRESADSAAKSLASEDIRLVAANLGAAAATAILRTREVFDDAKTQAREAAERLSSQMRR